MDEQTVGANPVSSTCLQLPAVRHACNFEFAKPTVSHLLQLQSFLITPICLVQWCFPAYKHKTEKHINTQPKLSLNSTTMQQGLSEDFLTVFVDVPRQLTPSTSV